MDGNRINKKQGISHYHHKFRNHSKCFEFIITVIAITLGLVIYFKIESGLDVINYFYLFLVVSLLPVLYLYLEYLFFNPLSAVFTIDSEGKKVIYSDRGISAEFGFDEIKKVVLKRSPSWSRSDHVHMLPFEQFHYARIFTESKSITITCLLTLDVAETVDKIGCLNVIQETRLFPSILME